jgi:hypothetical protein
MKETTLVRAQTSSNLGEYNQKGTKITNISHLFPTTKTSSKQCLLPSQAFLASTKVLGRVHMA